MYYQPDNPPKKKKKMKKYDSLCGEIRAKHKMVLFDKLLLTMIWLSGSCAVGLGLYAAFT